MDRFDTHQTRAVAVQLVIRRVGDFALTLAPTSVTIAARDDAVAPVNVVPLAGSTTAFAPDVTFTATGLPSDTGVLFDPNPSNGLTTPRVRTTATVSKRFLQGDDHRYERDLQSQGPAHRRRREGHRRRSRHQCNSHVGLDRSGRVGHLQRGHHPERGLQFLDHLAVKNLPPFTTATVTQQSASQATISVATSATTPAGTFPLQITGTSGTLSATVQVGLVVA